MKKKMMVTMLTLGLTLASSMTVCAAPQIMPDGTVFDAEYYAQTSPDVAAALGTDPAILYQHYALYGKAEGRQPASPDAAAQLQRMAMMANYEPAGDYTKGSVYGPKLSLQELAQVKEAVKAFMMSYDFSTMSDYEKVATAHDYLCVNVDYAPDWRYNRANTAWGALVYGQAQCSGYARAMKALCDAMGIGCYYVHADASAWNPSHQWNQVCIDGGWYILDVQANDKSNFRAAYLVSSDAYARTTGMHWDRSLYPPCVENYGAYDLDVVTEMRKHKDWTGKTYYQYGDGWITFD